MKQLPLAIVPPTAPGFDNFVPGDNQAALYHLQHLAMPSVPLYLWGPAGSGKTHLLAALAARCQDQGARVGWFDAGDALPWTLQADWALVVVDRCDQLDNDHQQAAFALFVEAGTHGVQWVAAGRLPPVDLPLRDDLRSRLGWGPVFALQPLDEAHTRAALRREADRRGIWLSDEVMGFLLTRFERDMGNLMKLLDRLDDFALAEGRAVTVPLLKKMLAEREAA
ncbi:DnaA regulatory inactivator Hda [Burkholderiales bacterium JOSHI_001]|nr:DnaA regulatory inactivator Hda [Burkholderiales bacterium JOSHI_001]